MKTNHKSFAQIFAEARKNLAYHIEGAIMEFTEELCRIMEAQGVTKAELAKRLDCKPAFVTKLLSGQNNFTLETMVKLARALESEIKIHLQGPGMESFWKDEEKFKVTGKAVSENFALENVEVLSDFKRAKNVVQVPDNKYNRCAANEELALAA
jgi:transcriptional regulator with XRE-family HTH domain